MLIHQISIEAKFIKYVNQARQTVSDGSYSSAVRILHNKTGFLAIQERNQQMAYLLMKNSVLRGMGTHFFLSLIVRVINTTPAMKTACYVQSASSTQLSRLMFPLTTL